MNVERTQLDGTLVEEELVAYLDGELEPTEQARVERRLADDAAYRHRLSQLQKAWDLLDTLQRVEPDAEFARSTVEMVAIQQEKEVEQSLHAAKARTWLAWLAGGAGVVAASVVGFFIVQYQLQAPERALIRDMPVIQRVDQYNHVESVDFLEKLRKEGLFAGEVEDAL
jgi:anti-sigma factor RsiW